MEEVVVNFRYEKETTGCYRYKEEPAEGQPPRIGTVYFKKWAMPGKPPRVTVVIK